MGDEDTTIAKSESGKITNNLTWPTIPFDLFLCVSSGNHKKISTLLEKGYFQQCKEQMKDENQAASLYFNTLILTFYEACKGGLDVVSASNLYNQFAYDYLKTNTPLARCNLLSEMVEQYTLKVHKSRVESNYSLLIRFCIAYIFEHIEESIKVNVLAKECKVSVATLRRHFMKEIKISPNKFIMREKIRRAAFLLKTTNLSNTQISYKLGFCTQSYFNEQFKSITGITPTQYRLQETSVGLS